MSGRRARLVMAAVAYLGAAQAAPRAQLPGAVLATQIVITSPETVVELDHRELPGIPTRLAWAPDHRYLYLRVSRFDRWANETASHAIVDVEARTVSPTTGEPPWASRYWFWKSAPASPGDPTWKLSFDAREEQVRTTNVPRGGDIAGFMSDPGAGYDELAQKAILANQKVRFERLTLNGRVIDETVNTSLTPGRRFGWSPPARGLIAVADRNGHLVLIDRDGKTQTAEGTKQVLLPAWSEDGTRIAFVERVRNERYALRLVRVGQDGNRR